MASKAYLPDLESLKNYIFCISFALENKPVSVSAEKDKLLKTTKLLCAESVLVHLHSENTAHRRRTTVRMHLFRQLATEFGSLKMLDLSLPQNSKSL